MTPVPAPARRRSGFTLIELILVLLLIGIMTSIVAPTFTVSPSQRALSEAQVMVSTLELARSHSLAARQMVRVVFDVDGGTYTAYVDHDRDRNIEETEEEREEFPEFGAVELEQAIQFGRGNAELFPGEAVDDDVTLEGDRLDLSAQGVPEPWGTMGTVYLRARGDANAVAAVSIASSGGFRAWRWDATERTWR